VLPLHGTGIRQEPDGAVTRRYELLLISNFIFIILKSKQNKTIYIIKIIIFFIFFLGKKIGNREGTETLLSFQMNGGWVPLQDEIIFTRPLRSSSPTHTWRTHIRVARTGALNN
jgi:hypothetical protein